MKRAPKSAGRVVVLENSDPIAAETEAIQSRIRQRAFDLSQTRPPDAQEIYDWIMAESEIISVPPAELVEKDGTFQVKFAVAGIDPDDVHVMIAPDQVALRSQYTHEHAADMGTVHFCDFKSATLFRSVSLPHTIDVNSIKVDVADGMVFVTAVREARREPEPARIDPAPVQAPRAEATQKEPAREVPAPEPPEPQVKQRAVGRKGATKKSRSRLP